MPPDAASKTSKKKSLSDAALRAAKSAEKPYKIAAGGGLYLEVTPTGKKLWRWKYRYPARDESSGAVRWKENRFAIGAYPDVLFITSEHIHAELGEILSGARPGRTSPDQITLYKSVGVAVQDAVAAQLVLNAARQQQIGREIDI